MISLLPLILFFSNPLKFVWSLCYRLFSSFGPSWDLTFLCLRLTRWFYRAKINLRTSKKPNFILSKIIFLSASWQLSCPKYFKPLLAFLLTLFCSTFSSHLSNYWWRANPTQIEWKSSACSQLTTSFLSFQWPHWQYNPTKLLARCVPQTKIHDFQSNISFRVMHHCAITYKQNRNVQAISISNYSIKKWKRNISAGFQIKLQYQLVKIADILHLKIKR